MMAEYSIFQSVLLFDHLWSALNICKNIPIKTSIRTLVCDPIKIDVLELWYSLRIDVQPQDVNLLTSPPTPIVSDVDDLDDDLGDDSVDSCLEDIVDDKVAEMIMVRDWNLCIIITLEIWNYNICDTISKRDIYVVYLL